MLKSKLGRGRDKSGTKSPIFYFIENTKCYLYRTAKSREMEKVLHNFLVNDIRNFITCYIKCSKGYVRQLCISDEIFSFHSEQIVR